MFCASWRGWMYTQQARNDKTNKGISWYLIMGCCVQTKEMGKIRISHSNQCAQSLCFRWWRETNLFRACFGRMATAPRVWWVNRVNGNGVQDPGPLKILCNWSGHRALCLHFYTNGISSQSTAACLLGSAGKSKSSHLFFSEIALFPLIRHRACLLCTFLNENAPHQRGWQSRDRSRYSSNFFKCRVSV